MTCVCLCLQSKSVTRRGLIFIGRSAYNLVKVAQPICKIKSGNSVFLLIPRIIKTLKVKLKFVKRSEIFLKRLNMDEFMVKVIFVELKINR
jgi:hypothetical protein